MKLLLFTLLPLLILAARLPAAEFPEPAKLPVVTTLPDPLVGMDGKKIDTAEAWKSKRAPELRALFQHYMYGSLPPVPKKVEAKVERIDKKALGGKAILAEVTLTVAPAPAPPIHLLLVLPPGKGPHPVFAGISFVGNHALLDDPAIRLSTAWAYDRYAGVKKNRATEASRGTAKDVWPIDSILSRGYGLAVFYSGDVDPDRKEERGELKKAIDPKGQGGTIAGWAWGVSRVVDYLLTRDDVDKSRIIAVGHSRLGKTALLAGAMDERIALAIPHQAGCGGTAPSRTTVGEKLKDINKNFPHWFNAAFKQFSEEPARLPFDQHCLAALMAPRPVLYSNAVKDTWANPNGQFEALRAADPVYRLLGVEGLAKKDKPAIGVLSAGKLGYWVRPGTHQMNRDDWKVFLDYADAQLGKPGQKSAATPRRRLLLVGMGPDGHPPGTHEYLDGLKEVRACLGELPGVEIVDSRAEGAWKDGPELLGRSDAAVLFLTEGAAWMAADKARREAFAALMRRGGGLTVIHWAMGSRKAEPVPAFVELVGGCHGGPDRKYAVVDTTVSVGDRGHPVARGLKAFKIKEEFYYKLKLAPGITPILKAEIEGEPHVVAWAYMPGPERGRAFGFSGLHFHSNWKRAPYRKLMAQAVTWTLGL